MINCGMVVALGTDFNPNAHCLSMPMVMHLACVNLKMTLNEVRLKVAEKHPINFTLKKTECRHYLGNFVPCTLYQAP